VSSIDFLSLMQWKVSSSFAAITSLFLLSAGDLVVAQAEFDEPYCTATAWRWSFNSLGQNPCTVVAYLMSTCYGSGFDATTLNLESTAYLGPTPEEVREAGGCWCNTVAYSLISACSTCRGGMAIPFSEYTGSCRTVSQPSTFPNPVPAGTNVPQWALVAITGYTFWDSSTAQYVGDTPEIMPGELIDTPNKVVSPPPSSSHTTPKSTATLSGSTGSKQGAIAGGLVWGVTTMAAISGLALSLVPQLV